MTNDTQEQGGYLPPDKSRKIEMVYQQGLNDEDLHKLPVGTQFKTLYAPDDYNPMWRIITWEIGKEIYDKHLNRSYRPYYIVKDGKKEFDHDPREDK